MAFREENVRLGSDAGIVVWNCSVCGVIQPFNADLCRQCSHPRDKAPASEDVVIENWQPNEGEYDDNEVEEQHEGMYQARQAAVEVDDLRFEGELQNEDEDFASDDNSDWDDTEFLDDATPSFVEVRSMPDPQPEGPQGIDSGWLCSCCGHENSLLDIGCTGCNHVRSMGDDSDDVVMRRPEITAGQRPNAIPDEKDTEEMFEVWQCAFCTSYNDFNGELLPCRICQQKVDTTVQEFYTFDMKRRDYEQCVAKEVESLPKGRPGFVDRNPEAKAEPTHRNAFVETPRVVQMNCAPQNYPKRSDLAFTRENAIGKVWGKPTALPIFTKPKLYWRSGVICFPSLDLREAFDGNRNNGLFDRGLAVNSNGLLAVLTRNRLRVYRPQGSSFVLEAEVDSPDGTQPQSHRVRVRFHGSMIFIFMNYVVYRFELCDGELLAREPFEDDYIREQGVQDIDVDNGYVIACWKQWCCLYTRDDTSWFHDRFLTAVRHSSVLVNPNSFACRKKYLYLCTGGCLFAFHAASRNQTMLWINGNLPRDGRDISFCVSDQYGVFTSLNGDIVQSYYDARDAQPIFKSDCRVGSHSVTPRASPLARSRHLIHDTISPFENVTDWRLQYDSSYAENGRLLCYDDVAMMVFMCLPRFEFASLESLFQRVFGYLAAPDRIDEVNDSEDEMHQIVFMSLEDLAALSVNNHVDIRCDDGRFYRAVVRARGGNDFMVLQIDEAEPEIQRIVDVASYFGKIAVEGAVSCWRGSRLGEVKIGSEVEVNLSNDGWSTGRVVGSSVSQVQVLLGNGEIKWTHLDFVDEIRRKENAVRNLVECVPSDDREEIETEFAKASAKYSEDVVRFVIASALELDVSSSPDGLRVFAISQS